MFERFTERARQVVTLSQEEARLLHHRSIGTEHLLLGLLRERDAIGFRVLLDVGADPEEVRSILLELLGTRPERRALPHAPDVAAALARAADAAREEGADHVELRHLRQVLEGP